MALTAWDTRLYAAAQSQFCLSVTEVYVGACNKGNHDTFGDTSECIEQREQRGYISKSSSTSSRLSSHLSVTNSQTVPNQYVSMTQSLSISSSGENHTTLFFSALYRLLSQYQNPNEIEKHRRSSACSLPVESEPTYMSESWWKFNRVW